MYDILTAIQSITLLVVILGCIPYGIWIIFSMVKKRWKRVIIQIVVPVIWLLSLWGVSAICAPIIHAGYLAALYDAKVTLGLPVFSYRSDRSFNGDGYSISVYELPATIRHRFESADESLLSEFPKPPSYRKNWHFEHWREAPFDPKFQKHLEFALSSYDADRVPELSLQFKSIQKAVARKGTYYALFYNNPGGYIGDIDLFIVDLVECRLYSINHNT